MHVYERRRARLQDLLADTTAVELARRTGVAASTLSRYLSEPGSKGFKNMSEENARKIEAGCGKPEGWMDKAGHTKTQPATSPVAAPLDLAALVGLMAGRLSELDDLSRAQVALLLDALAKDPSRAEDVAKRIAAVSVSQQKKAA